MPNIRNSFVSAALCASLVGACTNPEMAKEPIDYPSTEAEGYDNTEEELTPETEYREPECSPSADVKSIGRFALNVGPATSEEDPYSDNNSSIVYWHIEDNDTLAPTELVDSFISDYVEENNRDVSLVFEPGIIPSSWPEEEDQSRTDSVFSLNSEKQLLLGRVNNLLLAIDEYPNSLLSNLGINQVRVDNEYERYAGHFSYHENEILINYDSFRGNTIEGLQRLRQTVAHEVAHAAHYIYCEGNIRNDKEISDFNGGFAYIGHGVGDDASREDVARHYSQIPDKLLEYGEDRMFARPYAATNVAEDFATLVEFTLERRGVIQPGDKDYGSPLQQKQALIISRLDQLMPGFQDFAEERTVVLRREPDNEANVHSTREISIPTELIPREEEYDPEEIDRISFFKNPDVNTTVAVLNGAIIEKHEDGSHGGRLIQYPVALIDPEGKITAIMYRTQYSSGTIGYGENRTLTFFEGQLPGGDIVPLTLEEQTNLNRMYDMTSSEADEFFSDNPSRVVTDHLEE